MADTPPIRVLLVDDEVSYLRVLTKRLTLRGMEPMAVQNGQEAIRVIKEHEFDIALLDLKMVGMDGLETLRMISLMAPELKVILLTGHGGEKEARKAVQLGAVDYLVKPCDLDTLIARINAAVTKTATDHTHSTS
ncbi:MAG: response regulator [Desulfovibrio sp.]|uniref:response regulator n=1 Tax=Desulfovibrio sp. 7SRBS1 TaxID=3378064 RepID=UPI003B3E11C2